MKVDPRNLESQNKAKNIFVVFPSFPIKIWGKSVQGFPSFDRTNKQTNRDYYFIYIDTSFVNLLYINTGKYQSILNGVFAKNERGYRLILDQNI